MNKNTIWIVSFSIGGEEYISAANYGQALDGAKQYLNEQDAPDEVEIVECVNSRLTPEAFYAPENA